MKIRRMLAVAIAVVTLSLNLPAQDVAIKTNLLPDIAASPNLGVEVGLKPHWSLDLTGELCLWNYNRHKWRHWLFQPEARYWLCDRFAGHFFGLHAITGQYNFGNIHNNIKFLGSDFSQLTNYRFQGWAAGAGIAYGYSWILDKHWNLEAEIGIGWIYTRYDKYECQTCGRKLEDNRPHNYVGPTKLAVNIEYIF